MVPGSVPAPELRGRPQTPMGDSGHSLGHDQAGGSLRRAGTAEVKRPGVSTGSMY